MVIVHITSPYQTGEVKALCQLDAMYYVIVGKISGARAVEDPDNEYTCPTW